MTDRFNGFTVILDRDIRDDDFKYIRNAVMMIKGVQQVLPNLSDSLAEEKAKHEIKMKLYDVINNL